MIYQGKARHEILGETDLWVDETYLVRTRDFEFLPFGTIRHLMIMRLDTSHERDWREYQRIKNELCGAEIEAIEIYPKESCLVDTTNWFHLWAFMDGYSTPFGFKTRFVGNIEPQRPR